MTGEMSPIKKQKLFSWTEALRYLKLMTMFCNFDHKLVSQLRFYFDITTISLNYTLSVSTS